MSARGFQLNGFSVTFRRLNWDWVGVRKGGGWTENKSAAATLDLFNLLYGLVNEPRSFTAKLPPTPHVCPALADCPPLSLILVIFLSLWQSLLVNPLYFYFVDFILFSDSLKDPLLVSSGGGTSWL